MRFKRKEDAVSDLQRKVVATPQTGRRWRLRMTRTAVFQCPILSYTWRGPTITGATSSLHDV